MISGGFPVFLGHKTHIRQRRMADDRFSVAPIGQENTYTGIFAMFVDLQRCFIRIGKDREPSLDVGRFWGRKIGGWLDWAELREHRRVVLLAEAASGKSAEFRNQADSLRATDHPAFFVSIEELADHGFEAALEPGSARAFEQWRGGPGSLPVSGPQRVARKSL
jgi:hypothetical protein